MKGGQGERKRSSAMFKRLTRGTEGRGEAEEDQKEKEEEKTEKKDEKEKNVEEEDRVVLGCGRQ